MYHPFNYDGVEGTCLWCGRKLRKKKRYEKAGDYGDGFLCGLNCGYNFGRRLAELGKRLIKVGEQK